MLAVSIKNRNNPFSLDFYEIGCQFLMDNEFLFLYIVVMK